MTDRAPSHGWLITNLLGQMAFGLLAMTICLPSMQEWGAIFDSDQATVQMTLSGYLFTYGVAQLIYGPLSDRYGRKRILLIGLLFALLGSALAAIAPDLPLLIAARTLQGVGAAAGMVMGRAMVQDFFHGPERTRVMAYVGMAMGLCPPLGTIIGGQLHVRMGWQANFMVMAVFAVVLIFAAWYGLPRRAKRDTTLQTHWLRDMVTSYKRLAGNTTFLCYIGVLCMTTTTFYIFLGGAPVVLGNYGVGPAGIGWYIMVGPLAYICGNFLTSHLINRHGEPLIMLMGQGFAVGSIGLMLALSLAGLHTALAFALPLALLGIGHGLLMPPTLAGTVSVIPALAGAAAAVAGFMQQSVGSLGGYVVGLTSLEDATSIAALMLTSTLAAVAMQLLLRRSQRAQVKSDSAS
jgi:DHA1 family bicyclomycin/chloramphenicol resistance-like MFS transporter